MRDNRGIEEWNYYKSIRVHDDYHHLYKDEDNIINAIKIRKDEEDYLC